MPVESVRLTHTQIAFLIALLEGFSSRVDKRLKFLTQGFRDRGPMGAVLARSCKSETAKADSILKQLRRYVGAR